MTHRLVLAAATASAALAGGAFAAGGGLSLFLHGGGATRKVVVCGDRHPDAYTSVRRGKAITFAGLARPKPGPGHRVVVEVKRCIAGGFHDVWRTSVAMSRDGLFHAVYPARRAGDYKARAKFRPHSNSSQVSSNDVRFIVR
jgi:hypothetical protein